VGGGPPNAFGKDFRNAGYKWTKELCMMDSDGLVDSVFLLSVSRQVTDKPTAMNLAIPAANGMREKKQSHNTQIFLGKLVMRHFAPSIWETHRCHCSKPVGTSPRTAPRPPRKTISGSIDKEEKKHNIEKQNKSKRQQYLLGFLLENH